MWLDREVTGELLDQSGGDDRIMDYSHQIEISKSHVTRDLVT